MQIRLMQTKVRYKPFYFVSKNTTHNSSKVAAVNIFSLVWMLLFLSYEKTGRHYFSLTLFISLRFLYHRTLLFLKQVFWKKPVFLTLTISDVILHNNSTIPIPKIQNQAVTFFLINFFTNFHFETLGTVLHFLKHVLYNINFV